MGVTLNFMSVSSLFRCCWLKCRCNRLSRFWQLKIFRITLHANADVQFHHLPLCKSHQFLKPWFGLLCRFRIPQRPLISISSIFKLLVPVAVSVRIFANIAMPFSSSGNVSAAAIKGLVAEKRTFNFELVIR